MFWKQKSKPEVVVPKIDLSERREFVRLIPVSRRIFDDRFTGDFVTTEDADRIREATGFVRSVAIYVDVYDKTLSWDDLEKPLRAIGVRKVDTIDVNPNGIYALQSGWMRQQILNYQEVRNFL